jgi:transcriptional regulator with GAF, ATPase, and Fis domain
MIKVNCAALPAALVESELFGREKGAFTGALSRQAGRFDVANGSTLFLDEIAEMPLETQAKLLRVLQEGEFERLGSPRTIKVDVRIISATNRDLAIEVEQGRFRRDLYYRLNIFPIQMPPLRERLDDIPQLVWQFVNEFGERMGKKIRRISNREMEMLKSHPWPGNIRELRNVIEHAMIVSKGESLELHLPCAEKPRLMQAVTLEDMERRHIRMILDATNGRIKGPDGAAERLGLKPSTLYSRMLKLGLHKGHS